MSDFTIKETANYLGISVQAIYKEKENLKKLGYMQKDSLNKYIINESGLNYLKDRQQKRIERIKLSKKQVELNELKPKADKKKTNINIKESLNEQSIEIAYLKDKLNDKLNEINKLENEKREMQTKLESRETQLKELFNKNTYLLESASEQKEKTNKERIELLKENERLKTELAERKKGFFKRLFNR